MKIAYWIALFGIIVATGCGRHSDTDPQLRPSPSAAPATSPGDSPDPGAARAELSDWTPAEHRTGPGKWKDCGVYVDGVPVGFLFYGELPRTLEPVWEENQVELPYGPGEKPGYRTVTAPRFTFADYLEAVGVDLDSVQEMQLHGGRRYAMVFDGQQLRQDREHIRFRFGGDTHGKSMPDIIPGVAANTSFDKLTAVSVYIDKKPPTLTRHSTLQMDGNEVEEIPYFGTPLRGGVRVYRNDRLATVLKRNAVAPQLATKGPDGEDRYPLLATLHHLGMDTAGLVELEIIYDEQRPRRYDRQELASLYFTSDARAKGEVVLGDDRTPAQALALYTEPGPAPAAEQ